VRFSKNRRGSLARYSTPKGESGAGGDLGAGTLVRVLETYEPEPLPVQLVAPSPKDRAQSARAFLEIAAAALEQVDVIH
jgi:hypothetical protein